MTNSFTEDRERAVRLWLEVHNVFQSKMDAPWIPQYDDLFKNFEDMYNFIREGKLPSRKEKE